MSVCTSYVSSAQKGQKRVLGPLELKLQTIVSHHVLRPKPGPSLGAISALNHSHLHSPESSLLAFNFNLRDFFSPIFLFTSFPFYCL